MLSFAAAMRGRVAIVVLALCFQISNALETPRLFPLDHRLSRLVDCGLTLGVSKCLTAFSAWRARRAIEAVGIGRTTSDLNADVEQFPWERYANASEENLYTELCDGTEGLLKYRRLALNVNPEYTLQLGSNGNGTLNVDVIQRSNADTGRGHMKKLKKKFYNIIPLLLVPGLIMSAILPFVLPALKLMVIKVGILNNMALSGAVFTLLRNNAFNDVNQHKIIYVNDGYHNEKHHPPVPSHHHHTESNGETYGEMSHHDGGYFLGDGSAIKEVSVHANLPWIQNGDETGHGYYTDIKRSSGRREEKETLMLKKL
ncbi:unnamed protein product, partial [Iphiclides podalirius]